MACVNVSVKDLTSRLVISISRICFKNPIELFCYLLDSDGNKLLDSDNKLLITNERI